MKRLFAFVLFLSLLGASFASQAAVTTDWHDQLIGAIKNGNFNQVNIIAASHPESQGAIALFLLQQSQTYKNNPDMKIKVFTAATPFISRMPASDTNQAAGVIRDMLNYANDPEVKKNHPAQVGNIYLVALRMSSQPNVVAYDPNLHAEVLEAADDFVKTHPQDADKKLLEEVSLAEAGGAPETTPIGVINPSRD